MAKLKPKKSTDAIVEIMMKGIQHLEVIVESLNDKLIVRSVTKHFPKTMSLKDTSWMTISTNCLNAKNVATFCSPVGLGKYLIVHETQTYCHYFNNDKECPFEKIGCKFIILQIKIQTRGSQRYW